MKYQLLSGETVTLPKLAPDVSDFLVRARVAAADPTVDVHQFLDLVYGLDNPILDQTIVPGRAWVTKAVFANPVYHVLADLIGHKRIQLDRPDVSSALSQYTIRVPEAAARLGIATNSIRVAIKAKKLDAVLINGHWYVSEESIGSYKVGNRGRKKTDEPKVAKNFETEPGGRQPARR